MGDGRIFVTLDEAIVDEAQRWAQKLRTTMQQMFRTAWLVAREEVMALDVAPRVERPRMKRVRVRRAPAKPMAPPPPKLSARERLAIDLEDEQLEIDRMVRLVVRRRRITRSAAMALQRRRMAESRAKRSKWGTIAMLVHDAGRVVSLDELVERTGLPRLAVVAAAHDAKRKGHIALAPGGYAIVGGAPPRPPAVRVRILAILFRGPATTTEIRIAIGRDVHNRLGDMVKAGLIEFDGKYRLTADGRAAAIDAARKMKQDARARARA